jgi:hypothetical protein
MEPNEFKEAEVVEEEALDLRSPRVPITVEEIAALGTEQADAVIKARVQIIKTLRAASIKQCHASDWVLYKDTRTGRVLAYLEDKGAQRLMPLWGIGITRITPATRENSEDGESYAYTVVGDGYCNVTRQEVLSMEGTRYSTERFAEEKTAGIQRETSVKKAARANLEGRIVRNLAGLNGVPLDELILVTGDKDFELKASKGRGYGTQDERAGAANAAHGIDPGDIPNCEACESLKPSVLVKLVFRPGKEGREGFFGCVNYQKHENKKIIIPLSKLKAQIEDRNKRTKEPGDEQ